MKNQLFTLMLTGLLTAGVNVCAMHNEREAGSVDQTQGATQRMNELKKQQHDKRAADRAIRRALMSAEERSEAIQEAEGIMHRALESPFEDISDLEIPVLVVENESSAPHTGQRAREFTFIDNHFAAPTDLPAAKAFSHNHIPAPSLLTQAAAVVSSTITTLNRWASK